MSEQDHYEKGIEFFSDDRLDEAIAELEQAVEIAPDFVDALHALAMSYYHRGDLDQAIRYGERMREADPENIHAYTSLSMFYNAKGFIEKAEEMGLAAAKLGAE